MKTLKNISIADFKKILAELGCHYHRSKGGHEAWLREGLKRPIIFQTHVDPVPEMVVRNAIRDLELTREEFLKLYEQL